MRKKANGEGTIYKRKDGRWCASYYDENCKRRYLYGKCREDVEDKLTRAKLKMTPKYPNAHFDQLDDGIPVHINSGNYYNYFIFENLIELELIPTYYCNGEKMFTLRIKPTREWIRACDYTVSQSAFAEDYAIVDGDTAHVSTTVAGLLIDIAISHVFIGGDEYMDKWDKVRREFKKKGKVISRFSMNFLRDYYGIPFSVKVKNGFYMVSRITDM